MSLADLSGGATRSRAAHPSPAHALRSQCAAVPRAGQAPPSASCGRPTPGALVESRDKDPKRRDALVNDGYVERTKLAEGVAYRLAHEHAEGLGRVVTEVRDLAENN